MGDACVLGTALVCGSGLCKLCWWHSYSLKGVIPSHEGCHQGLGFRVQRFRVCALLPNP
jgi:hypothetical protein